MPIEPRVRELLVVLSKTLVRYGYDENDRFLSTRWMGAVGRFEAVLYILVPSYSNRLV